MDPQVRLGPDLEPGVFIDAAIGFQHRDALAVARKQHRYGCQEQWPAHEAQRPLEFLHRAKRGQLRWGQALPELFCIGGRLLRTPLARKRAVRLLGHADSVQCRI